MSTTTTPCTDTPTTQARALAEALVWLDRGACPIPIWPILDGKCACPKATCSVPGKHPMVRWKEGETDHPMTRDALTRKFTEYPTAGLALLMGRRSDLFAIDIDAHKGGLESWATLETKHGPIPPTPMADTPSGGQHHLFRWPGWAVQTNSDVLGPGIDVRGDGGLIVVEPSPHRNGGNYAWSFDVHPDEVEPADAPAWLLDNLTRATERAEENRGNRGNVSVLSALSVACDRVPATGDETDIESAISRTVPEGEGQRHRCIFNFARELKGIPVLADAKARDLRDFVKKWHAAALPTIGTKSWEESWADFLTAWPRIKFPKGTGPMADILKKADAATPPDIADDYDELSTRRLICLCRELQRDAGEEPFFLACTTAGDLLNVERTTIWRRFKVLEADGVLSVVERGTQKRATRYRYLPEERHA